MLKENAVIGLSSGEPAWMLKARLGYLKKFNELPMPSFKYGLGIFVDIGNLDLENINPFADIGNTAIVSKGVEVLRFKECYEKYGKEIKEYFMTDDVNKLSALHGAFFNEGFVIKIPDNTYIKDPIIINLDMEKATIIQNVLIIAGKNSKAVVLECSRSSNTHEFAFRSQVVQLVLEENATLEYQSYQNFSKKVYNFSKRRAEVKANAFISWIDCFMGSKFTQVQTVSMLEKDGATAKNSGIIFGDGEQCYDVNTRAVHLGSRTTSDILAKVVLDNKAKAVYRGLVKINKGAIKCNGYQKEETILLSEDAQIDAVPNLEIGNNDVKCSHGVTVSQVDDGKLFYMMSRGLSENDAKHAIVEGFFNPTVLRIGDEGVQLEIKNTIQKRLKIKF